MNKTQQENSLRIAEEAAEWAGTLDAAGADDQRAFVSWLRQSSKHVEEFLLASAVYRALDGVDPLRRQDIEALMAAGTNNVVPLPSGAESALPRRLAVDANHRRGAWLAAAVLSGAALLCGWTWWAAAWKNYATETGEQRVFELSDGSVVHLNTRSRMQVRFKGNARDIRLLAGEALFKVAHDPKHPFRVHTDNAVVQAVGTQFNVYRRNTGTTVSVIEGAVRVTAGDVAAASASSEQPQMLVAGEETRIAENGHVTKPAAADTVKAVAWRQRRLVFHNDRLAEVAAEFNRYNRTLQIQIEGKAVAARQLTGVFDADAPESLVRFLADVPMLAVEKKGAVVVIRERALIPDSGGGN